MPDPRKRFYTEIWPHAAAVLRSAQFLTRNDAEADDLAQDVMLKAFRHINQLTDPRGAKAWLMTILRNARLDRLRAKSNDASLEDLAVDPPATPQAATTGASDPAALLEAFSDRQIIAALKKLPEDMRWTLLLVDVEGLDHAQAAAVLGVAVGTVKSRSSRARAALRDLLGDGTV